MNIWQIYSRKKPTKLINIELIVHGCQKILIMVIMSENIGFIMSDKSNIFTSDDHNHKYNIFQHLWSAIHYLKKGDLLKTINIG